MFHLVFCRSADVPTGQDLANWVLDAAAFDDEPDFKPPFEQLDRAFGALEVIYAKNKRPIQVTRVDGKDLAPRLEDAIDEIEQACEPGVAETVIAKLRASTQVYSIEFDELGATDDVQELVYDLDARIAQELDGLIYVPSEAIYDGEDNQPICSLT